MKKKIKYEWIGLILVGLSIPTIIFAKALGNWLPIIVLTLTGGLFVCVTGMGVQYGIFRQFLLDLLKE